MTTTGPEHDVTIARMVTESLLESAQEVERAHAAVLMDPGLGPALARTADLVEQAELVEMAQADEQRDIVEAHRRGLPVGEWRDQVEAAIAYLESPEYAQAVWERQGEEHADEEHTGEERTGEDWESQADAYRVEWTA
ncbi:hypothetical protein [Krasilnikovia sp. MM14-A1259]|uniref:hypothetical protein n=1 Tax=Krasilnikovia sp. MM14-A1259 TaxID=3373539 RepID=UPI00381DC0EA